MNKFLPNIYQKSIYTIDYHKLKNSGIKCILFDLDNTLVPNNVKVPSIELKELFAKLKSYGFRVVIFSNSPKRRINSFREQLSVASVYSACKPFKKNFLKIMEFYKYDCGDVAIVGDQLLTDVLGGNGVGITTVLIEPMTNSDIIFTKPNRLIEKFIFNKYRKKGLLVKGNYYE